MTTDPRQEKIHQLEQQIIFHKSLYYQGKAQISDAQYDELEEKLKALAPASPVLELVGSSFLVKDIAHDVPMLSLGKTRNPAEIIDWLLWQKKNERKTLAEATGKDENSLPLEFEPALVSVKMDGSSASLIYRDGRFVQGKTRGDGYYGENITSQLSFVDFPKEFVLPGGIGNFEIRGEVCISHRQFTALCAAQRAKNGEEPKAIRNIVAGLLHTKFDTAAITNCAFLDFIGYEIICEGLAIEREEQKFTILEEAGFIVPPRWKMVTAEDFAEILKEYQSLDEESGFDFLSDGLVVAIADLSRQKARGATAHHPKGKMAFKFQSATAETTLKEVEISVGRTGKLSFVGIVEPVELSGATVSRVTLHNGAYIQAEALGAGARIEISRSGEVIPKHERTLVPAPEPIILPEYCPYCGSRLAWSETKVDLLCGNRGCQGRLVNSLRYFVAVVGIEFLGERSLQKLVENGFLKGIADLYNLTAEKLVCLKSGTASDKQEQKILASINEHRRLPLSTFLVAVGIDGFGLNAVKLLTNRYPGIDDMRYLQPADLEQIAGLGKVLSCAIVRGLQEEAWPLLTELDALGVKVGSQINAGPLKDKNIVVTGSLNRGNRKQIEAVIEAAGGNFSNTVGRKTDYLVCNEPSGSTKYQRALSYGIKIITEDEFYQLLGGAAAVENSLADNRSDEVPPATAEKGQLALF